MLNRKNFDNFQKSKFCSEKPNGREILIQIGCKFSGKIKICVTETTNNLNQNIFSGKSSNFNSACTTLHGHAFQSTVRDTIGNGKNSEKQTVSQWIGSIENKLKPCPGNNGNKKSKGFNV